MAGFATVPIFPLLSNSKERALGSSIKAKVATPDPNFSPRGTRTRTPTAF